MAYRNPFEYMQIYDVNSILGLNQNSYKSVTGTSTAEWAKTWTADLADLSGYYNQKQVDSLLSGLGTTSSATYNNQLKQLSAESNKLYSYTRDPNSVTSALNKFVAQYGDDRGRIRIGDELFYRNANGNNITYDLSNNAEYDVTMSPIFSQLYKSIDTYSGLQKGIIDQLTAQQKREQQFIGQINSIVQQATLAKTNAQKAAAEKAQAAEMAKQQAALNASAQANAKKLAEQKAAQEKAYAEAQAKAKAAAAAQLKASNESALVAARSGVAQSRLEQAQATQSQLESEATEQVAGGEATVQNAVDTKKKGTSTRTERYIAARTPAASGGGPRV